MLSAMDNPYLNPIVCALPSIRPSENRPISCFPLDRIVHSFQSDFYSYGGSHTTPPYLEGVAWFVRKSSMVISKRQLECFLCVLNVHNYGAVGRSCQPLNDRIVCYSYEVSQRRLRSAIG